MKTKETTIYPIDRPSQAIDKNRMKQNRITPYIKYHYQTTGNKSPVNKNDYSYHYADRFDDF